MIYLLAQWADVDNESWLRLFYRYISSRAGFAFLGSLIITASLFPALIRYLQSKKWINRQRSYMVDASSKEGVPVMGGILIFVGATTSTLLWCNLMDPSILVILLASVWFFALGFGDDLSKIREGHHDAGFSRGSKYGAQIAFALFLAAFLVSPWSPHDEMLQGVLHIPMIKKPLPIGMLQIPFIILSMVFIANAVNFADGMDGLASAPSFMTFLGLGIFAYIIGHAEWSKHFLFFIGDDGGLHRVQASELVIVCSALSGALLGFLWYNSYPAQIFMGDCGSMYLGGVMATLFILLKQEILFPIFGLLFLLEIFSVIIQEWIGIKWLGRRIFFRAPLHENLKYHGWSEPKIVVRMWILSGAAMALGLLTIKLR